VSEEDADEARGFGQSDVLCGWKDSVQAQAALGVRARDPRRARDVPDGKGLDGGLVAGSAHES
jgi:hypothetical protein